MPIDIAQAGTLFGIVASAVAVGTGFVRIGDRLWKRPDGPDKVQTIECAFQHKELKEVLLSNAKSTERLIEAIGRQSDALREQSHAEELRHQVVVAKLNALLVRTNHHGPEPIGCIET